MIVSFDFAIVEPEDSPLDLLSVSPGKGPWSRRLSLVALLVISAPVKPGLVSIEPSGAVCICSMTAESPCLRPTVVTANGDQCTNS